MQFIAVSSIPLRILVALFVLIRSIQSSPINRSQLHADDVAPSKVAGANRSNFSNNYLRPTADKYDYLDLSTQIPVAKLETTKIVGTEQAQTASTENDQKRISYQNFLDTYVKCSNHTEDDVKPLLCYQCQSRTGERENDACDSELWRFARRSERYLLRKRCPIGLGSYCVKKTKVKRGLRITERGCFGPGPVRTTDGSHVELRDGCVEYNQNGFTIVTCLCKSNDLCNAAPKPPFIGKRLVMLVLSFVLRFMFSSY